MRVPIGSVGRILAALLVVGLVAPGSTVAQGDLADDERCQAAFAGAESILATLGASSPSGTAAALAATRVADIAAGLVDLTILSCPGQAAWLEAATAHQAVVGDDASDALARRCTDPTAGLADVGACATSETPPRGPVMEAELVDLPDVKPRVRGASRTRYYPIEGLSPDELFTQMQVNGSRSCPAHALACVNIQPNISPAISSGSGSCRVVGIRASLSKEANLPRWAGPDEVYPELVDWWRLVAKRIGVHETEHIRIANRHLARLRREIVGKPCATLNAFVARWSRDLTAAQDAFDAKDMERPWPDYEGPTPP